MLYLWGLCSNTVPLLEWWSSSVRCMLQKKNKPFIIKLCIIEIFEADFNSGLKYILGRKLLYHGEEHGINSTKTHGSRPGRATHDVLTITEMSYYIARLDKVTILSIFNNAVGCYYRMQHNLMTITTASEVPSQRAYMIFFIHWLAPYRRLHPSLHTLYLTILRCHAYAPFRLLYYSIIQSSYLCWATAPLQTQMDKLTWIN